MVNASILNIDRGYSIYIRPRCRIEHDQDLNFTQDPERSLLQAILRRAIDDALGGFRLFKNDSPHIVDEARRWIFTEQPEFQANPFSFVWCCEQLGVSVKTIRHFVKISSGSLNEEEARKLAKMPRYRVSR